MTDRLDVITKALLRIEGSSPTSHHVSEDCWYSCPKSGECCDGRREQGECDCGADRHNADRDAALLLMAEVRRQRKDNARLVSALRANGRIDSPEVARLIDVAETVRVCAVRRPGGAGDRLMDVKVMDAQEARGAWERARHRYLHDAVFHQVVESLLRAAEDLDYAPRDIYDVATLVAAVLDGRGRSRGERP